MSRAPLRAILTASAGLLAALAAPAGALSRDWTSSRAADAANRDWERRGTPADAAELKAQSNAAARIQKAREDEWDRKTRRATRSICTGAKGC